LPLQQQGRAQCSERGLVAKKLHEAWEVALQENFQRKFMIMFFEEVVHE
jgi:hypothetical protein